MFSSTSKIVINRPIEAVFDYLSHMENEPLWYPEVKRVTAVNDDPPGVGKTYEMMARRGRQNQEGGYEITRFEPPTVMELKVWEAAHAGTTSYELEQVNGGTRLVYTTKMSLGGIAKLFEPVIGWETRRTRGPRMLENLRHILETDQPD